MTTDCRNTLDNFDGNGFCFDIVGCHFQSYDAGFAVNGFGLVEDEIAHTVVDLVVAKIFDGLQGVCVVTNQHVGSCIDELMGFHALARNRLQRVFPAPVQ